jgi:hypothetical protein
MTSYALGPYRVETSSWPEHWQDYAKTLFAPLHDAHPLVPLAVRCASLGQGGEASYDVAVEALNIHSTDTQRFSIAAGSIDASFDIVDSTLVVDVKHHSDHAHITLGNALRAAVSVALPLRFGGLMLHASSAMLDGQGLAFAGLSTAGKTTMALGFEEGLFLSDDISLVTNCASAPMLVESPFFGSAGRRGFALQGRLRAVGLLAKDPLHTRIEIVGRAQATIEMMRHAVCFTNEPRVLAAIMSRVDELTSHVAMRRVSRWLEDPSDVVGRKLLASCA